MKTTFDTYITDNPSERVKFDREYQEFLLSEFVLENRTLSSVLNSLGYRISIEKM